MTDFADLTGGELRKQCRAGVINGPTAGMAKGFVQANLVIVRSDDAGQFEEFCRRNPKPCPLLEVMKPGQYEPTETAPGADLRTDLPRYRIYERGVCRARPTNVTPYWTDDCVAFLIGCSFTFEAALLSAGVPVRHIEQGCNVPMYRTNIMCNAVGAFVAPLVVSMRPMTLEQAGRARRVTAAVPQCHGEPVHVGDPAAIGINDLSNPDYGNAVSIHPGEVPVFWACGVTPIEAVIRAKLPLAITHEPGHMLVTDLRTA